MKSKAKILKVGYPVRGSRTGRPIMVALDLLGRRMSLRVLWELHGESMTFRVLQDAVHTNPSLLNTRLKELRAAGIVEHTGNGYSLTRIGQKLLRAIQPLSKWAQQWGIAVALKK